MLKNRAFAWILTILIMILSVFIGAYASYAGMRNAAAAAFEREMLPLVNEAMIHAHDMQSIAQNYLSAADITAIGISRIVSEIQATDDPVQIYEQFVLLNRAVWEIYDRLIGGNMTMSGTNRNLAIDSHADFMLMDTILSQMGYNNTAGNFNDALNGGLGFLTRPFISEMPRFD